MTVSAEPAFDNHELVAFCNDSGSGLRAIIAVHNTRLGPAVGGCRMFPYADDAEALHDVLRLSRGMTYKSALAGLPFGGGKSVIIGDPHNHKSRRLLEAMGDFIQSQGGRYIAAEDSGTGVTDLQVMRERTSWVSGLCDNHHGGDPSPSTAYGVYLGIRTAVRHRMGIDELRGIRVAVQGLGHVGYHLARQLSGDGAIVYGADLNRTNLERAIADLGIIPVNCDEVLGLDVDVVAPCAMGAVWHTRSIGELHAAIVCGAANNQLASELDAGLMRDKGVLYCPDFLVNAGGIIDVHHQHLGSSEIKKREHVARIETTLLQVLDRAERQGRQTHEVAEQLAEEVLHSPGPAVSLAAAS